MSDPTYRIEVSHHPGETFSWYVCVYRLSDDGFPVFTTHGHYADELAERAQDWVARQNVKQPTQTLYVDDDGRPVEGHSVRA